MNKTIQKTSKISASTDHPKKRDETWWLFLVMRPSETTLNQSEVGGWSASLWEHCWIQPSVVPQNSVSSSHGAFLTVMGVPPVIFHFNRIVLSIQRARGVPPLWKTPVGSMLPDSKNVTLHRSLSRSSPNAPKVQPRGLGSPWEVCGKKYGEINGTHYLCLSLVDLGFLSIFINYRV